MKTKNVNIHYNYALIQNSAKIVWTKANLQLQSVGE